MIKRIVVALDPDEDTKAATRYAIRLAKRFDAGLTGLAVVDVGNLHTNIGMGGYGAELYALEIREGLTAKTAEVADKLLVTFRNAAEEAEVKHVDVKKHGASAEVIIEEMKYHDLLIAGRDSRFFYNEPERETKTLARVVKNGVSPTLVVTDEYRDIEKIMVAFDGSAPAARSLKDFVHLLPYGKDVDMELVSVVEGGSRSDNSLSADVLNQAESYLRAHHFSYISKTVLDGGKAWEQLLIRQTEKNPDLVVLGAHSVSAVRRATFGSTTHEMIVGTRGPLFLSP